MTMLSALADRVIIVWQRQWEWQWDVIVSVVAWGVG